MGKIVKIREEEKKLGAHVGESDEEMIYYKCVERAKSGYIILTEFDEYAI